MDQLTKFNPDRKPPKKPKKFSLGISIVELPLVITLGSLIFAHIWFGSYLFSDELSEDNRGYLKYIPLRTEYEDMKKGFRNIRKRFLAKMSDEAKSDE